MSNRKENCVNKILSENRYSVTGLQIKKINKIIDATIKAFSNELLEETTDAGFGDADRGENFLDAVPASTIIRIRDEWLEI